MLLVSQINLPAEMDCHRELTALMTVLTRSVIKILKCDRESVLDISIVKKSIDARQKPDIFYSYSVAVKVKNQDVLLKRAKSNRVSLYNPKVFKLPEYAYKHHIHDKEKPPVVCGFGPAGMAVAYVLAKTGHRPLIIERGQSIDKRQKAVESFWQGGRLSSETNVQFGEGGAGAFSDGKLNTGNKDKDGLLKEILKTLVKFGAPEEIAYTAKPHLGTEVLHRIVKNIREDIKAMGGSFLFETKLIGLELETDKGKEGERTLKGIHVLREGKEEYIETDTLFLAIGHSARDSFRMLYDSKVAMEPKAFAIGYRVAHLQSIIDLAQYGKAYEKKHLPAADYKLVYKAKSGRSVFSFCMCPGGYIVNAASKEDSLVVNGMSYSKRDGYYANSAIVVSLSPEEAVRLCPVEEPLFSGMTLQEEIEKQAFKVGNGNIPVCFLGNFKSQGTNFDTKDIENAFKGGISIKENFDGDDSVLPLDLHSDFLEAMEHFGEVLKGFDGNDTIVAGTETRTSSPIRIVRDENHIALGIDGLYPCGEGAGYAGGIMSAAVDGIKSALLYFEKK